MTVNPKLMPGARKKAIHDFYDYDTWSVEADSDALYEGIEQEDWEITQSAGFRVIIKVGDYTAVSLPAEKVVIVKRFVDKE